MAQIKLLLWLKFKLAMRQFTGSAASLVGTILAFCLLAPLSIALGVGGFFATYKHPKEHATILGLAFFGVYLLWLLTPLLGFKSQFYDITKLFLYPLSHRKVLVASIIGGCLSLPTLFFLTGFLGMALGISRNPVEVVCRLILFFLFLFHSISLGELILLSSLNFLKSRRFKDIAVILGPFMGIAFYLTFRFGIPKLFHGGLLDSKLLDALRYQPSYWIALAFCHLWHGDLSPLLPFILGFAPLTVIIVLACAKLQERAFFADYRAPTKVVSSPDSASVGDESAPRKEPLVSSLMGRALGDEIVAIAGKEAAMIRREPVFKTVLIQQLFLLVVPLALPFFVSRGEAHGFGKLFDHLPLFVTAFLLVQEGFILQNVLGLEGRGINLTFSFPTRRWKLFLGKNICYLVLFSVINVAFISILGVVYKKLQVLPLYLVFQEILLIAIIGLGNPVSIYVPIRLTVQGSNALKLHHRRKMSFVQSMISALTRSAILAIISPMILLMFLPKLIGVTWLYFPFMGLCALYAVGIYFGSLKLSEFLLSTREEKLLGYFLGDEDWV